MNLKKIEVLYNTKNGVRPSQGYEGDFAYDIYASEGRLVPPLTFKSVPIPTDLKIAFDPSDIGMKISLRSGVANNTPLVISNAPGIVEGTYRGEVKVLVRNTFIDNRLVEFAFNEKGERIAVKNIPTKVLESARKFYDEETELLNYEGVTPEISKMVFKTHVPAGTVYIAKHTRFAQVHFQNKVFAEFVKADTLPESVRGEKGFGSSGSKFPS
ncbi:putative deoxyuridine 5'-triphosphate nucleotidohydrolase-like protein [Bacillus phage Shbh1]|uniref:dUTP diphosphatase n=1 Tax=Bacillus phage Shbh1 TaxID=1796992 RepID=A0A142F1H2_9CAUD|nr:putative deoxyuridine 5'-triphosphate nucleotidohydrolase-like protein [Bacillus phage Shbh1]AMQ66629.1 putative deoxyuridine 5'-triphosphate nucleotidohydrolase-like protein [Bacillus phage Shbh1]